MSVRRARFIAALALASMPLFALAHHGVSRYDMQTVATLDGVVENWGWQNPHTSLTLRVERDGETRAWEIEGAPPGWMSGQGWNPESLEHGERITITYHPARSADYEWDGRLMEAARTDGTVLKVNRPRSLGGP
jgi:hypothetical protein